MTTTPKIFPIVPGAKTPYPDTNGLDDAKSREAWDLAGDAPEGCQWAVNCGASGIFVIDIDGEAGEEALFNLELKHGALPETYEVQTPRGGRHIYFRGQGKSSVGKLGPKIDTRGAGGYVLLPGAYTADGKYTHANQNAIAVLPEWVRELAGAQREKSVAAANVVLDLPVNIDRATVYLRALPPVAEGGRNDAVFRALCFVRELGCSEAVALDLTDEHYNQRFDDPLGREEVELIAWSAEKSAQNDAGSSAVRPATEVFGEYLASLPPEEPEHDTKKFGPFSFDLILRHEPGPVRELVGGLLERGIPTMLAGVGGTHKSRLAIQWGLSLAAGKPIFGRECEPSRFVYLSYEDHYDEVARRAQAIANRLQISAVANAEYWDMTHHRHPLIHVMESGLPVPDEFGKLFIQHLKDTPGHKFIVIDSTYNALKFEGNAKFNEGAVNDAIGWLQNLCDTVDATVVFLWHPSQAGNTRGDASGWSVAWHNAPRARLSISPIEDAPNAYLLETQKRSHAAKGAPLTLHFEAGILATRTAVEMDMENEELLAAVVRVSTMAAEAGTPITRQKKQLEGWVLEEIAREIGMKPNTRAVRNMLENALAQKRLRYLAHGKGYLAGYYPAGAGPNENAPD